MIVLVLLVIMALFLILLFFKELLPEKIKKRFCVLCSAVTITWILMFILYWMKIFRHPLLIALLMGSTMLGIFYLVERNSKEQWKLFRLPFFLTLFVIAYSSFGIPKEIVGAVMVLILLWGVFLVLYLYKNNYRTNNFVKKIIACCKNW